MAARLRTDILLLAVLCGFLFFYGLGSFGLAGADEPRYAQVAREMFDRHDWVGPTLQGKPWLEKPVLYYWEAMIAYSLAGVSDKAARLPSAFDATLLVAAVYTFLRRFRAGSELDGALITAGSAGIIAFARAASTDMPLASTFAIAMLSWFAWHEDRRRWLLAVSYGFLGLAVLAKGPVAAFLALVMVALFSAIERDWSILSRTLWWPGILLFFAVSLPWYVAVQLRDPDFFRVFILEHNLARFGSNLYHHQQPFWFYVPVLLLAVLPWTVWLVLAVLERFRRRVFTPQAASFTLFLLIWLLVPVIFFSFSQSKLPGYILPAVPAATLLVSEYVSAAVRKDRLSPIFALLHAALCGAAVFGALIASGAVLSRHLVWGNATFITIVIAALITLALAIVLIRSGFRMLRFVTLIPVVLSIGALVRLAGPALDDRYSARPIAETIRAFSREMVPVAVYHTTREQEYGLEFYLNRAMQHYDWNQVPTTGHVLVAARGTQAEFIRYAPTRKMSYLTAIPAQHLDLYWVAPLSPETLKP
jgi:4-amino-4-deoxy-L-arabinose transferase-like glycosyltransferase